MLYKLWASAVVTVAVVLLWAAGAFVMNWYAQDSPLIQLLAWLLVTMLALYAEWHGITRIVRGQTISDVLNAPWS